MNTGASETTILFISSKGDFFRFVKAFEATPLISVLDHIRDRASREEPVFALLFDPDECEDQKEFEEKLKSLREAPVELILLGGSLLVGDGTDRTLARIRKWTDLPVVLFPGSPLQLNEDADATLFLSLISGRNPELLIGQQVIAAPHLKRMNTEVIPTGYMLIDGGKSTTASYMSGTAPIPRDKDDIAMATAMAGEMLGLNCIYLDAGSGAEVPVSPSMIRKVADNVDLPVIVGGGIRSKEGIQNAVEAGADMVVIGSAFEKENGFLNAIAEADRERKKEWN